mgnify:CR=1 FL=1
MSLTPKEIPTGAVRYNTDSNKMEVYIGSTWMEVAVSTPNLDGGARGIWGGGNASPGPIHADIEYITISTAGNSIDFGSDISDGKRRCSGFGSRTRGFIAAGRTPTNKNTIDFVTFSSTGTTTAWGDTLNNTGTADNAGFANSTRGVTKSGYTSPGSAGSFDFITMSSTGGVNDFGDLIASGDAGGAFASPTRGVIAGGYNPANDNTISFVTITTTGNAQDFGDLIIGKYSMGACSNSTRGVWAGGQQRSPSPDTSPKTLMDFIQIATKGNSSDFGDLSVARSTLSGVSSKTRGVWGGGYEPSASDVIDYFAFATQGAAVDFGNLSVRSGGKGGSASNGHGGL